MTRPPFSVSQSATESKILRQVPPPALRPRREGGGGGWGPLTALWARQNKIRDQHGKEVTYSHVGAEELVNPLGEVRGRPPFCKGGGELLPGRPREFSVAGCRTFR